MCREEVRLNRRLAPDLYLGVRSVAEHGQGFELAAENDPQAVDYLVEMRRYDEQCTLAAKLERGELRRDEVVRLGGMLARFHDRARRVVAGGAPVLAVERRMTENFHELLAIVEQRVEVGWVLELERFVHAFVVAHAQTLDARATRPGARGSWGSAGRTHSARRDAGGDRLHRV
jgi:aminoglycoside phosphotransferase family enzyme